MASTTKTTSGNFRARKFVGYEDGKRKYLSATGKTEKAAIKAVEALVCEYKSKQKCSKLTLDETMENFIDNKTSILSPASIATYRSLQRNAFESIKGNQVADLTLDDIQKCVNLYASCHTPKSTRNVCGFLSSVLATSRPDLDMGKVALPKKVKKQSMIPSDDDITLLLSNIKGTPLLLPVLMACELGMRRGEICAITWDDIDTKKKLISINKAMVRDEFGAHVIKSTKTYESTRIIRLTKNVIKALPKVAHQGSDRIVQYVPNELSDRFTTVVKRIGTKHFTFHSLRHYNTSVMLKLGVPDKYAMERGGWSNPSIMKEVYQHTFADQKDIYADKIEDYFANKKSGESEDSPLDH